MSRPPRRFSLAWIVWAVAFIAIEAAALMAPDTGGTLSEHVWLFLDGGPGRYLLVGGFLSWLAIHFLGRGKWG